MIIILKQQNTLFFYFSSLNLLTDYTVCPLFATFLQYFCCHLGFVILSFNTKLPTRNTNSNPKKCGIPTALLMLIGMKKLLIFWQVFLTYTTLIDQLYQSIKFSADMERLLCPSFIIMSQFFLYDWLIFRIHGVRWTLLLLKFYIDKLYLCCV